MANQNDNVSSCKVKGCRYSNYHTTIGHRCGTCNSYGHGQLECNNATLKQQLSAFLEEQMPEDQFCTFSNCTYPWSHSSSSHHCFRCGGRGSHPAQECRLSTINQRSREPLERFNEQMEGGASSSGGASSGGGSSLDESATKVEDHIIHKRCPICREYSNIDLNMQLYTGSECCICLEDKTKIIFSKCKHASVCHVCALLL